MTPDRRIAVTLPEAVVPGVFADFVLALAASAAPSANACEHISRHAIAKYK